MVSTNMLLIDQIKKSIIISIDLAKNQIPNFESIFEIYQEAAKDIYESFVEPQMTAINIIYSDWKYFSERVNKSLDPNVALNKYSRFSNRHCKIQMTTQNKY